MGTPQIIIIVWYSANLLAAAYFHGKSKTGRHNFWATFFAGVITVGLLIWGKFFSL